jgi:cytochrome c oxidase subunit II
MQDHEPHEAAAHPSWTHRHMAENSPRRINRLSIIHPDGGCKRESMKKLSMLSMLIVATLISFAMPAPIEHAQDEPRRIEMTAKRFTYDPGEITLKKGQPVLLVLKSADVAHGLRIRELNIDVKLTAGGTQEVRFTPQKTGDIVGHCTVFCGAGHGSMALKVHVVD